MTRDDVRELHYIAPIGNVPSIMVGGILSHVLASRVAHESVAMQEIQDRRANKQIPGAGKLHEYVNLYFDAHNPMLSRVRDHNDSICVLRVDGRVLDIPDAVIADHNASSDYARFYPVPEGLAALDRERVFAQYWLHRDDPFEEWRHKSEKCAEVLVPNRVAPEFVIGSYVANAAARARWDELGVDLIAEVKRGFFF